MIVRWRADVNGARHPIVFASVAVRFFEIFKILSHPRLVAVAEVDERGVAIAQVLVVIVHECAARFAVEPRDNFEVLFEEVFFDRSDETTIAVLADEIDLFQF